MQGRASTLKVVCNQVMIDARTCINIEGGVQRPFCSALRAGTPRCSRTTHSTWPYGSWTWLIMRKGCARRQMAARALWSDPLSIRPFTPSGTTSLSTMRPLVQSIGSATLPWRSRHHHADAVAFASAQFMKTNPGKGEENVDPYLAKHVILPYQVITGQVPDQYRNLFS